MESHLEKIANPKSGLSKINSQSIILKYFLSSAFMRVGDTDQAQRFAKETIEEVTSYYGHDQLDMTIDPMLILIHTEFDYLTR